MEKGVQNRQQAPTRKWSHSERHVEYGRAQHQQDNQFFFIDDYNVKRVRTASLWFQR
uniref:Uncharacterized protein n=1 Tax=Romanomermis culicivorax TaxID=13658 RepID=A0A915L835_ROMCU